MPVLSFSFDSDLLKFALYYADLFDLDSQSIVAIFSNV